jgi:hypothetical protein
MEGVDTLPRFQDLVTNLSTELDESSQHPRFPVLDNHFNNIPSSLPSNNPIEVAGACRQSHACYIFRSPHHITV